MSKSRPNTKGRKVKLPISKEIRQTKRQYTNTTPQYSACYGPASRAPDIKHIEII